MTGTVVGARDIATNKTDKKSFPGVYKGVVEDQIIHRMSKWNVYILC